MARAVAGQAGVPFFHASGSEFDEVLVGQGARRVRDLFRAAKARLVDIYLCVIAYCYETIMFGRVTYMLDAGALFCLRDSHSVTSPSVVLDTEREYTLFSISKSK